MRKIQKFLFALIVVVFASCTSSNNTKNTDANQQANVTIELTRYQDREQYPEVSYVEIDGDNLVIIEDGTPHAYKIDMAESFEEVRYNDYLWNLRIARVDEKSPDYGEVNVYKFMDDIYGEPNKYDIYPLYIITNECRQARANEDYSHDDGMHMYTVACEIGLQRGFVERHPESKPLPELSFDIKKFETYYDVDAATVPDFVKNAKRVLIKGNMVVFDCEGKAVTLDILPLSDIESVYSEGYNWHFMTKADGAIPSMRMCVNTGFYEDIPNPDDRWVSLTVEETGYYDVEFNSWQNLSRKIMATYPTDEEYYRVKEEGILPDLSDEEEDYSYLDTEQLKEMFMDNNAFYSNGYPDYYDRGFTYRREFYDEETQGYSHIVIANVHCYPLDDGGWKVYEIFDDAYEGHSEFYAYTFVDDGLEEANVEEALNGYGKTVLDVKFDESEMSVKFKDGPDKVREEVYDWNGSYMEKR